MKRIFKFAKPNLKLTTQVVTNNKGDLELWTRFYFGMMWLSKPIV